MVTIVVHLSEFSNSFVNYIHIKYKLFVSILKCVYVLTYVNTVIYFYITLILV